MLIKYVHDTTELLTVDHDEVPRTGDHVQISAQRWTAFSVTWREDGERPSVEIELTR